MRGDKREMSMTIRLLGLFAGRVAPLGDGSRPSAIIKAAVPALTLGASGPLEDEQADLRVHGGVDKAVHCFPSEHYARLAAAFPHAPAAWGAGFLGENLALAGLTEDALRLGDRLLVGDAVLEVSQPRSPCWKIDARAGEDGVAAHIDRHHLTGWYCRVLQGARIDPASDVRRQGVAPAAPTPVALLQAMAEHRPDPAHLRALAVPALTAAWRDKLHRRADWLAAQ